MNLSRSFLSWELRSVSIAYRNLKCNTGREIKLSHNFFTWISRFKATASKLWAMKGQLKRTKKNTQLKEGHGLPNF